MSSQSKKMIALVSCLKDLTLTTVNAETGKLAARRTRIGSCREFIAKMPNLLRNVRSVVFNVFSIEPTEYSSNYEFCKRVKIVLARLKLPYCFVCDFQGMSSLILTAAKIEAKIGEVVIIILVNKTGHTVMQLQFTKNGWNSVGGSHFQFSPNESYQSLRAKIMGKLNPKKIIVSADHRRYPFMKNLNTILEFKDLIVFDEDLLPHNGKYIIETEKWMKDKSYTKYYIIPKCIKSYCIGLETGIKKYDLIFVEIDEKLPCTKEIIYQKDSFKLKWFSRNHHTGVDQLLEEITLDMNIAHQFKFIVNVDSDNFPSYKIEPIILPHIENMLPNMISQINAPVIGFYGNSSVICYFDKTEYKFLKGWNGMFGKQLYISFDKKKPRFMEDAVDALNTKPSFVVLDFIRIIAMSEDKVVNDGPWNFKFTKDDDNQLLIEFDRSDGTRGAATPAFLMAMLIKEHMKALKEELGEKPKQLIFCLLDSYDADTQCRTKAVFDKACELLKIEQWCFRLYLYLRR